MDLGLLALHRDREINPKERKDCIFQRSCLPLPDVVSMSFNVTTLVDDKMENAET